MTHAELLARISSAELSEWQAYLRLENEERDERVRRAELESAAERGLQERKRKARS